jgi:hypothetical protein
MSEVAPLHPVRRDHLQALTDQVAIMQHAIGSEADAAHGYCTDDVARALQVDLLHQRELGWAAVREDAWRSVRYLDDAFDRSTGRFRNFRRVDGSWIDGTASQDSQGRAIHALGSAIESSPDPGMVELSARLFSLALPAAQDLRALRAQASILLGCDAATRVAPSEGTALTYRVVADRIGSAFRSRARPGWPWPESRLTYENGLPVQALIVGGRYLDHAQMLDDGLRALDWLILEQTRGSHLSPIGNGWWVRGGEKSQFDQQPIEATALLLAAEAAYIVTGADRYRTAMERAYGWFLGENDLGVSVAVPERGAGYDGLTPRGVNRNQGAESTLMWLMAAEHIRVVRAGHRTEPARDRPETSAVRATA